MPSIAYGQPSCRPWPRRFASSARKPDYAAFAKRWAVRRNSPDFWAFSDALLDRYRKDQPIEAGVLDYNRFENR